VKEQIKREHIGQNQKQKIVRLGKIYKKKSLEKIISIELMIKNENKFLKTLFFL
jgi:hypothetical protein